MTERGGDEGDIRGEPPVPAGSRGPGGDGWVLPAHLGALHPQDGQARGPARQRSVPPTWGRLTLLRIPAVTPVARSRTPPSDGRVVALSDGERIGRPASGRRPETQVAAVTGRPGGGRVSCSTSQSRTCGRAPCGTRKLRVLFSMHRAGPGGHRIGPRSGEHPSALYGWTIRQ